MSILITLLTTVLVLNCFFLVLLILIQLPKKEHLKILGKKKIEYLIINQKLLQMII